MRIVDIRERAIPLKSDMRNSSFDFSEMTTSIVAVVTDVVRDGRPVVGFAFNSTGRYACGAAMRARFIPRILGADPRSLLDEAQTNFDPGMILAAMMQREKSGGHSERSIAIGTIEVAVWDAVAKIAESRSIACWPSATTAARSRKSSAMSAAAGTSRDRRCATCRTRCAAISTPATPW